MHYTIQATCEPAYGDQMYLSTSSIFQSFDVRKESLFQFAVMLLSTCKILRMTFIKCAI